MFWEVFIAALIALGGAILLQRAIEKAEEHRARLLSQHLNCPSCKTPSLEWRDGNWQEDILCESAKGRFDRQSDGFIFHCSRCNGDFQFTHSGHLHAPKVEL